MAIPESSSLATQRNCCRIFHKVYAKGRTAITADDIAGGAFPDRQTQLMTLVDSRMHEAPITRRWSSKAGEVIQGDTPGHPHYKYITYIYIYIYIIIVIIILLLNIF